jgi:hypothetical protein
MNRFMASLRTSATARRRPRVSFDGSPGRLPRLLFVAALAASWQCGTAEIPVDSYEDAGSTGASVPADGAPPATPNLSPDGSTITSADPDGGARPTEPCPASAIYCESFEKGNIDPARWKIVGFGRGGLGPSYGDRPKDTRVEIDSTKAAIGRRSLRFKITSPLGIRQAFIKTVTPATFGGGRLFVRYFMYIDPLTPNRWFTVFDARDTVMNSSGEFVEYGMKIIPTSDVKPGTNSWVFDGRRGLRVVPVGRWACLEYAIQVGNEGRVAFHVDERPVDGLADVRGLPRLNSPDLYFGVLNSHDDLYLPKPDGFNVWIDEIVVSHERIGCAGVSPVLPGSPPGPPTWGGISYASKIQPFLKEKCAPCHTGDSAGGHDIGTNYLDAKKPVANPAACGEAKTVGECTVELVRSGEMPKGKGCDSSGAGRPGCLTEDQKVLLRAWVANGLAP